MKRLFAVVAACTMLLVGLAVPAHADVGQNCQDFMHNNGNQVVTVCVSINYTHLNGTNNVHVQYRDGKGADVYFLGNVDILLMKGSNTIDESFKGDLPIFDTFSDTWNQGSCLFNSTNELWGYASFVIEWNPGVFSNLKSVSSDFVGATVCM